MKTLRRFLWLYPLIVAWLLIPSPAAAVPDQRAFGYCASQINNVPGIPQNISTNCSVTVYFTGTLTKAPLFLDAAETMPTGNPVTADTNGYWFFYAANGTYDIQLSGGVPAIGPYTLAAVTLGASGGGGGGGGNPAGVNGSIQYKNGATFGGSSSLTDGSSIFPHGPSPYYDVVAYGAVGDGTTDDTAAIQATINAANTLAGSTSGGTGGIVYFPCGKIFKFGTLDNSFNSFGQWILWNVCGTLRPTTSINFPKGYHGIIGIPSRNPAGNPAGAHVPFNAFDLTSYVGTGPVISQPDLVDAGPLYFEKIGIINAPGDGFDLGAVTELHEPTFDTLRDVAVSLAPASTGACINSWLGFGLDIKGGYCSGSNTPHSGINIRTGQTTVSDVFMAGRGFYINGATCTVGVIATITFRDIKTENFQTGDDGLFNIDTTATGGGSCPAEGIDIGPGIFMADNVGGGSYLVDHIGADGGAVKVKLHGLSAFTGYQTAVFNGTNISYLVDSDTGIQMNKGFALTSNGDQNCFGPCSASLTGISLGITGQGPGPNIIDLHGNASSSDGNAIRIFKDPSNGTLLGGWCGLTLFGGSCGAGTDGYGWFIQSGMANGLFRLPSSGLTLNREYTFPDATGTACLSTSCFLTESGSLLGGLTGATTLGASSTNHWFQFNPGNLGAALNVCGSTGTITLGHLIVKGGATDTTCNMIDGGLPGTGSSQFNTLTSGTNTQATMLVGTGASLGPTGAGTIAATSSPFSGLTSSTNTTAAMVVGAGGSLDFTSTGLIDASKVNSTSIPSNASADQTIVTTAPATGSWASLPLCTDSGGNHLNYNTATHLFSCGTSGGTAGSAAFNTITSGTNASAAMLVGTGSSLGVSGSGTIAATSAPFSGLASSTNTTGAMVVGTGGSLDFTGTGLIDASKINSTSVPVNSAADQFLGTTASATGAWAAMPLCTDAGGNHLNYNTATHAFSCGTSGGTAGSAAFNTITSGTNASAAMVVGTGSSLGVSGSGTIAATSVPFSGVGAGTNTGSLVIGTGGSIGVSGTGTNNATAINGTTVPVNSAADQTVVTTASATGSWAALPACLDTIGQHLNYNTTTHLFACGTSSSNTASGTVTSFGANTTTTPSQNFMTASVATSTTTPSLTYSLANVSSGFKLFGNCSASAAAPDYVSITEACLPNTTAFSDKVLTLSAVNWNLSAGTITLPNVFVRTDTSNAYGGGGLLQNFSSATMRLPVAAGGTTPANGGVIYDSTNNNWHFWDNGADRLMVPLAAGFVSGHCPQPTSTGGSWLFADAGLGCFTVTVTSPRTGDTVCWDATPKPINCTNGIPQQGISGTYIIAGNSAGSTGDRGHWLYCTAAATITIPDVDSTGFDSSFDVTIMNQSAAACTLNRTTTSAFDVINMTGLTGLTSWTIVPGETLNVAGNETSKNYDLHVSVAPISGAAIKAASFQATAAAFSGLPACAGGTEGMQGAVTDSTTATWGATITGGSTNHVLAYCDGTNWTVAAK